MKIPPLKKILSGLGIAIALCLVCYNIKDVVLGAPLSVHTVLDGTTVTENFLPISGRAKHAVAVEINGRPVSTDTAGVFNDGIVLSPGYNIVEITQRDHFGKEKRRVFHLVAEPSPSAVASAMNVYYQ